MKKNDIIIELDYRTLKFLKESHDYLVTCDPKYFRAAGLEVVEFYEWAFTQKTRNKIQGEILRGGVRMTKKVLVARNELLEYVDYYVTWFHYKNERMKEITADVVGKVVGVSVNDSTALSGIEFTKQNESFSKEKLEAMIEFKETVLHMFYGGNKPTQNYIYWFELDNQTEYALDYKFENQ